MCEYRRCRRAARWQTRAVEVIDVGHVRIEDVEQFSKNRKIKDHVCECCRIAHAFDAQGHLVLLWRDVMDGMPLAIASRQLFVDVSNPAKPEVLTTASLFPEVGPETDKFFRSGSRLFVASGNEVTGSVSILEVVW